MLPAGCCAMHAAGGSGESSTPAAGWNRSFNGGGSVPGAAREFRRGKDELAEGIQ